MEPFPTSPNSANHDPENITEERAARRFYQMRRMEQNLQKLDKKISDAKEKLATLKEHREGQIAALLEAARDEGDLPLLPLFDDDGR